MNQNLLNRLPAAIRDVTDGMRPTQNSVGLSDAEVVEYRAGDSPTLFLKVEPLGGELRREQEILEWLDGKLPVPTILHWEESAGYAWLLMTAVEGRMACADEVLMNPDRQTVRLLAEGIRLLRSVEIEDCPFDNTLDKKLTAALENIRENRVDMADFSSNNTCTPLELWEKLCRERPPEELAFTHGDYCLPNIFLDDRVVTGFIDLGRAGIADRWQDVALCVRSLRYNLRDESLVDYFFTCLGEAPDWRKIEYYILLDELF
jgi:kanamycin kinase/aminoglycoside 3'-phosphotransferase-3